ncbi:sensory protein [Liquorilactobacillus aquaticus DSM 21051]|uniref:Sensory protein n=1 Tax=Liquorilactobacillus aquaticus DSM 21051 TaxID=1423725 RepID=A0A0R2D4C1_9LACO|nr:TspO/MBR family protein [Liquorilactobacillus aquaticus]KRM95259.1 sensory protein [Liquorilactobacillus aquaticus DSM 21051]
MKINSKYSSFFKVMLFIVIVEMIGSLSALFAGDIKKVYNNLQLPALAPPDFIFGIVWPFLYLLIGISGFMLMRSSLGKKSDKFSAFILYGIQLFVNFIWSIVFFNLNYYWWGLLLILILDLLVLTCIIQFFKISKSSSLLLYPYLAWILFATYLTFGVALLN